MRPENVCSVSTWLHGSMPRIRRAVEGLIKQKRVSAFSLNDALQGAKRGFIILDIVLSLIGSIALAVSSLGIMNTMVMSRQCLHSESRRDAGQSLFPASLVDWRCDRILGHHQLDRGQLSSRAGGTAPA